MSDSDDTSGTGLPFHLMPIALSAGYQTYQTLTYDESLASSEQNISPPSPIQSKQIYPQSAMVAYHEGWRILIRTKLTKPPHIDNNGDKSSKPTSAVHQLTRGNEPSSDAKLMVAYPMTVSSIYKKFGGVTLKFQDPDVPGKYNFIVDIKSAEYVGADAMTELTAIVVDSEGLEHEEDDEGDDDEEVDDEAKNEK
eukprot:CAMPEP_0194421956 /NCGR_PEP_ID=MMETSP0176-20130528/21224_1 /TAXON_ID=216777 /ORGANISM="Proboscia alata, Strain PI-D3" /LENGTH=194 /DNA_ID=CAMNT_0039230389 /DNA_START=1123 /DNA_END=1707 /DNA_ORIENTATION=-